MTSNDEVLFNLLRLRCGQQAKTAQDERDEFEEWIISNSWRGRVCTPMPPMPRSRKEPK